MKLKQNVWPYLVAPFLVLALALGIKVFAANSPFPPWLSDVTVQELREPAGSVEGHFGEKVAMFIFDTATDSVVTGTVGLGVYLPAGAIITQGWYKIITQFEDSGTGTVALFCEDANNILTAGDITGISANTITTMASTGAASTMKRALSARCEISAEVADSTQTAGKLIGFVRYIVGE